MKRLATLATLALCLAVSAPQASVFEPRDFATPELEQRYRDIIEELRCLVCQNQNIADSNAELAADLRRQVYDMLHEGADDERIIDFMVERYGDFVLYRPPFSLATALLWGGPFALGALGLAVLAVHLRRRRLRRDPTGTLSDEDRARLTELVGPDRPD